MQIKSIIPLAISILLFVGCTSKKVKPTPAEEFENLNKYQEYITEVSHGIISAQSDVRVVLNTPVVSWNNGEELDSDLIDVSPRTKGKVIALDKRTIAFVPENGFKQNTDYKFKVALSEIINDVPKDLETFTFGVKTLQQQFNVYTNAVQSHSKEKQYIEGQLRAADVLSIETVKQLISVTQNGKSLRVAFDEAVTKGTQFQFKIDNIQRYEEDSELEITWNGQKFDIESNGENTIKIPGKNNFTVLDAQVETADGQASGHLVEAAVDFFQVKAADFFSSNNTITTFLLPNGSRHCKLK
mgnify:CR=1 FL=1